MKILCWLKTIYRTIVRGGLIDGVILEGHTFVEDEVYTNRTVKIGHCEDCDKIDISWN